MPSPGKSTDIANMTSPIFFFFVLKTTVAKISVKRKKKEKKRPGTDIVKCTTILKMLRFSLLAKHGIQSTILVQDPEDWKSIGIIGVDVGTLKRDLDDVRERFPEFSFAVEEKRSQLYTNHWS